MTTTVDDPIRAEVERALNVLVDLTVRMPMRLATAFPRCVLRSATAFPRCVLRSAAQIGPLAEPVRVVRSFVDLIAAGDGQRGVVTPHDAPAVAAPRTTAAAEPLGDGVARAHARSIDAGLPIDDYESLAASQVVDRLPTLTPEELVALRGFEDAHRGRRTILGRIDQLLG